MAPQCASVAELHDASTLAGRLVAGVDEKNGVKIADDCGRAERSQPRERTNAETTKRC